MKREKFELGQTVMTRGIKTLCEENAKFFSKMIDCLKRHQAGDWGDLSEDDCLMNDRALSKDYPDRILSAYHIGETKIWIITEWDRSSTTVLLPEEY